MPNRHAIKRNVVTRSLNGVARWFRLRSGRPRPPEAALRGRALGGSTGTRSTTPRRDGRSTTLARSGLPSPSPSEHCAAVSTATLPIHARCPSSLAASHTHVWACSRAQERRPDPRLTFYSASALDRWDPPGGKAGGRGARCGDRRPPGHPGKSPARRCSSLDRPYRRCPHWGSVCFRVCSCGSDSAAP